jgi:hypothetical protein
MSDKAGKGKLRSGIARQSISRGWMSRGESRSDIREEGPQGAGLILSPSPSSRRLPQSLNIGINFEGVGQALLPPLPRFRASALPRRKGSAIAEGWR